MLLITHSILEKCHCTVNVISWCTWVQLMKHLSGLVKNHSHFMKITPPKAKSLEFDMINDLTLAPSLEKKLFFTCIGTFVSKKGKSMYNFFYLDFQRYSCNFFYTSLLLLSCPTWRLPQKCPESIITSSSNPYSLGSKGSVYVKKVHR